MTITISAYSATATTISTIEWSLTANTSGVSSVSSAGIYQVFVDLSNMSSGDEFEFRAYETVSTASGTQRELYSANFYGTQSSPHWSSPSVILGIGWDFTLSKPTTATTSQIIPWRISSIT